LSPRHAIPIQFRVALTMLVPRRTEHTVVKAPKSSHITPVLRSLHYTGKFTILVHSPNNFTSLIAVDQEQSLRTPQRRGRNVSITLEIKHSRDILN